jgi:hypothetical protein
MVLAALNPSKEPLYAKPFWMLSRRENLLSPLGMEPGFLGHLARSLSTTSAYVQILRTDLEASTQFMYACIHHSNKSISIQNLI